MTSKFCTRCGSRLSSTGICPNQTQHIAEDEAQSRKWMIEHRKKETVLNSILGDITDNGFLGTPHKHAWEPYGKGMLCCKVCGEIISE